MFTVLTTARAAAVAVCAVVFLAAACIERKDDRDRRPAIVFHDDTADAAFGSIDVLNLDAGVISALRRQAPSLEQWQSVLSVRTGDSGAGSALPLFGNYTIVRNRLRFTPRFPPVSGQPYHVRFDGSGLVQLTGLPIADANAAVLDTTLQIARASGLPTTFVVQVFPTADRLPVNLLRVYLHFSAPMSTGEAYRRVQLLDDAGRQVEDAFLVVAGEKELWDPERRRLTLLFDPGRIKRGLRPHEEAGLPLREGQTFTLVVDSAWLDAQGVRLKHPYRKRFTVGSADRALPRVRDWQLTPPRAGTTAPVMLEFPESLDQALLERLIVVRRAAGSAVAGGVTIDQRETTWRFAPAAPWQAGAHYLEVGTDLEDLAGNNLRGLFDVDRKAAQPAGTASQHIRMPFTPR